MTHNQKNSIIVNNTLDLLKLNGSFEDIEKYSRRTLVLSSGDVDRMAEASSRARLMMDLVKNPDDSNREFGSYYRGRRCHNNPANFMTSHTAAIPIPKRVIPTYPSLVQNLRWDSSFEKYSEDSQTETREQNNFHCKCNNCKMKHCPGRERSQVETSPAFEDGIFTQEDNKDFIFRDNIMRFTDNSTMTSNLTDAYCEVFPTSTNRPPETSETYISTSEDDNKQRVHKQTSSSYPSSILKKPICDTCCYQSYSNRNKSRITVVEDEAVRDTSNYNDYDKLIDSLPKRQFTEKHSGPPIRNNFVDIESCRKNLYNEGISDSIAETTIPQFFGCPIRMPAPMQCPVRKDFSRFHSPHRPSVKKDYGREYNKFVFEREAGGIPFAHREHSRYHYDCKEPVKKVNFRYDDDCGRHGLVVSSRIPKPSQASRVLLCDRTSSKMPKKLLSSERDIDSFISSKRMNLRF